jgi:CubicO group peptidase (beta-lactamase class C family)
MGGFDDALGVIDRWPATAAAAVIGSSGVLGTHGDVEHVFRLASVTKPMAALATLVAVEEGALSLDDPADDAIVPGATVRHLLAHASGLAPERMMRSFPPATRRVYSNVGIDRLGELLTAAVEMPFATYLDEALCRPLQLANTSLPGLPSRDGRSSVGDLARVVSELLTPTGLLHPSTLADLRTVQYPGLRGVLPGFGGQDPNDWGLGFEIRAMKRPHWTGTTNSPATYGHFGQSGTMLWIDPVAELGLVALCEEPFAEWATVEWPALSDAVLALAADR